MYSTSKKEQAPTVLQICLRPEQESVYFKERRHSHGVKLLYNPHYAKRSNP